MRLRVIRWKSAYFTFSVTVRPRVTELVQLGFAVCEGRNFCREGIYRAAPADRVRADREAAAAAARAAEAQLVLGF